MEVFIYVDFLLFCVFIFKLFFKFENVYLITFVG